MDNVSATYAEFCKKVEAFRVERMADAICKHCGKPAYDKYVAVLNGCAESSVIPMCESCYYDNSGAGLMTYESFLDMQKGQ